MDNCTLLEDKNPVEQIDGLSAELRTVLVNIKHQMHQCLCILFNNVATGKLGFGFDVGQYYIPFLPIPEIESVSPVSLTFWAHSLPLSHWGSLLSVYKMLKYLNIVMIKESVTKSLTIIGRRRI